jgi:hypothetical protein
MIYLAYPFITFQKKNLSITAQGFWEFKVATTLPEDQSPSDYWIFPPSNELYTLGILVGKVIESKSKFIRYDLRGGLNFGYIERPVNFRPIPQKTPANPFIPQLFNSSVKYNHDIEKRTIVGIVLNPTIDFPLSEIIGFSLGARANINHQDITVGFEGGIMIGLIR